MNTILIVDDDPFIGDIYSSQLKSDGYRVEVANTIDAALQKLNAGPIDLLVLDLNLNPQNPGPQDGFSILNSIRNNPKTKDLKVVVFSNYSANEYPELNGLASLGVLKTFLKVELTPQDLSLYIKGIIK